MLYYKIGGVKFEVEYKVTNPAQLQFSITLNGVPIRMFDDQIQMEVYKLVMDEVLEWVPEKRVEK